MVAASLLSSSLAAAPAQAAPGDPFDPADPYVFIAQQRPTALFKALTDSAGNVTFTPEGEAASVVYNAIAFNSADNYIYALVSGSSTDPDLPSWSLARIGQEGTLTRVGTETFKPSVSSTFGPDGYLYTYATDDDGYVLQVIDVTTGALIREVPITGETAAGNDIAYKDGFLWAMGRGFISRTDPATGETVRFTTPFPTDAIDTPQAGAAWTFGNGNLGFSYNGSGTIYQVDVADAASATPTFTLVSANPGPPSDNNDGTSSPGLPVDLAIVKSGPESLIPGETVTYTLTVTNNGQGNSSGFVVDDTVPAPLTNVASTSEGCVVTGNAVQCLGGRLPAGESVTYTITATVPTDATEAVENTATVLGNEEDPVPDNNTSTTTGVPSQPELSITKTSDSTGETRIGDTVIYTVTAENVGTGDYTAEDPAVVTDDLTGVLDDATFNDDTEVDRDGDVAFESPRLSWTGALPVGETVTLTYSATLTGDGDGVVRNVAFAGDGDTPACDPPTEDGVDPDTGVPCATIETELPRLSVAKTADQTDLPAIGETVDYTIVVTNEGPGDYTADAPATATDDLSDVLDDATLDEDSLTADVGEATFADGEITWTGPLAAGEQAEISYTVTYTGAGDNLLVNRVCVPSDQTAPGAVPCDSVQIPASNLEYWKSVDPASGTAVLPGQEVTYTLSFRNDGQAAGDVSATDDVSDVFDDADLITGPTVSDDALSADLNGDTLSITGSVPVGETITVSYTVQVRDFADQGDNQLGNVLSDPNGACLIDCTTGNPVAHLSIDKTSDAGDVVNTGDTVTYTVTVTNDGQAAYTVDNPATATDDVSGVLDDATYNDDAVASAGEVSYATPVLTWTGTLDAGESVSFTYSVTVTNAGDHVLENTASLPPELCTEDCSDTTTTNLPHVVPGKTSDPATGSGVQAGDVITYTLTFTNNGTAAGLVDSTDDLSNVLDDGDITAEPISSTEGVTATRTDATLRVVGELAAGETATVTYQVTIKADGERGDNVAGNVLTPDVPVLECVDGECEQVPPPSTEHRIGELDDWKTVDPASGTAVQAGQDVTYTLHFANTGEADVTVNRQDALAGVLDDADLTTGPTTSSDALSVSEVVDGRISVTGSLAAGQEATVSYTVTVRGDGQRGDDVLGNFLVNPGQEPPAECVPADGQRPDCTVNYIANLMVTKTSDPESGTEVAPGDVVTYTLTFTNNASAGAPAEAVAYTDHMADVLDDATLTDAPAADDPLVAAVDGDTIVVTGDLPAGQTATVTYTVTVDEEQGNHTLGNVIAPTGAEPICAEDSQLCTSHKVDVPPAPGAPDDPAQPTPGGGLAQTGVMVGGIVGAAALLLLLGLLAVRTSRHRAYS